MMATNEIARVFVRRTSMTPQDEDVYIGLPPLWLARNHYREIHISVCFTWDLKRAAELYCQWSKYGRIRIGGPALDDPGNDFESGKYLKQRIIITSRGCPNNCPWCFVPKREGKIRELSIVEGNVIQDNNLLACSKSHINKVFQMLQRQKNVRFTGGLQASLITDSIVEQLRGLKILEIWLAYDHPDQAKAVKNAAERLRKYFSRNQIRCYVLIGYYGDTTEKAVNRLYEAWQMGTLPFAMRYRTPSAEWENTYLYKERKWNLLTRQWSRPAIIKSLCQKLFAEQKKNEFD